MILETNLLNGAARYAHASVFLVGNNTFLNEDEHRINKDNQRKYIYGDDVFPARMRRGSLGDLALGFRGSSLSFLSRSSFLGSCSASP